MYLLQSNGVAAGTAQTTEDKMEHDPQHAAREFYPMAPHSYLGDRRFEGLPMRFSRSKWEVVNGAPGLGEHTHAVMEQLLGYTAEEIAALAAEVAI